MRIKISAIDFFVIGELMDIGSEIIQQDLAIITHNIR